MPYVVCVLVGYLIGTLNPSFIIAKCRGFDIRQRGSGNAGASNALIVFGKLAGVLCALFDILKATGVVLLMQVIFPDAPFIYAVTATACTLGHIFPFYMRFRGGKGLACLGGIILGYDWRVFLIMLTLAILLALLTRYICFVPMAASLAFPVVYGVMSRDLWGALILAVLIPVIFGRHAENLRRIREGKEMRLSYLWNKKHEVDRLRDKYPDTPEP